LEPISLALTPRLVEDFKIGMQHLSRWERAAVVTDVQWIVHAISLFGFLMPGAIKVFSTKAADEARTWIVAFGSGPAI
jgi:hypothetical protein